MISAVIGLPGVGKSLLCSYLRNLCLHSLVVNVFPLWSWIEEWRDAKRQQADASDDSELDSHIRLLTLGVTA